LEDDVRLPLPLHQPALFENFSEAHGAVELFPTVWGAVEEVAAPEVSLRHSALSRLEEMNAPRLLPLAAYMIATRLADPDLNFRIRVVKTLGTVLMPDVDGNQAQAAVLRYLTHYLSQMRTRIVYALLEVAAEDPSIVPDAARLLNTCPHAGGLMGEILTNRNIPLKIRKEAAFFMGEVGFLDTIPVLERLETRLASRLNGQQSMPFASVTDSEENELLPVVQRALSYLQSI
jgi:hypothetical protein